MTASVLVGRADIRWRGHLFEQHLRDECVKRLDESAKVVQGTARILISEPYPPVSAPGQPPHLRSGDLWNSVFYAVDNGRLIAIIGSRLRPNKYGFFLEIGTQFMAARPWLRPALAQSIPQIQAIFGRTLPGSSAAFRDVSSRSILLFSIRRMFGFGG